DLLVNAHLRLDSHETDVIGIYPLLDDNMTWLLAVDFDGDDWMRDTQAFAKTAAQHNIPASIERSRSGNGAHAWFFFAQPIPAKTARRMGSALLTITMEGYPSLSFSSYDRLFPSQDTLPTGGFGNLIALPLQGSARGQGGSLFIDNNGNAYKDQWAYLSSIQQITLEQMDSFFDRVGHKETLGITSPFAEKSVESDSKPWDKVKYASPLKQSDFPETVTAIKANMLHIEKEGISPRALNRIRRLAAFSNPEYYSRQRMRLYINRELSRIIDTSEETAEYLSLPRACESELKTLVSNANVQLRLENRTETGDHIFTHFTGKLRPDQQKAFKALTSHHIGVLSAATAFGKTVLAARVIAERQVSTLILVHTTTLLEQWIDSLGRFLEFDDGDIPPLERTKTGRTRKALKIGYLSGSKNRLTGRVDIAMVSSLKDKDEVIKPLVKKYGMVIADECHHVAASTFETVMKHVHARYVHGLSATPARKDGLQPIVFLHCGPIRHRVSEKDQNRKRGFVHQVILRFTTFQPPKLTDSSINDSDDSPADGSGDNTKIHDLFAGVATNEERNALIVEDILKAVDSGRTPIVLTQTTRQAKLLTEALRLHCPQVILLTGGQSSTEKAAAFAELTSQGQAKSLAIVATGSYVGEGFDFPRLDTLFIAAPVSWKGRLQQFVGRLNREYQDKSLLQIYDYVDIGVRPAESMYFKRLKHYRAQDYQIIESGQVKSESEEECVFAGKDFWSSFLTDIENVRKEVVLVCPRLHPANAQRSIRLLQESQAIINNKPTFTIYTNPLESYPPEKQDVVSNIQEQLARIPDVTIYTDNVQQTNTIVIDRSIIWFGNMSPLGYISKQQSIMRFTSREVAERLLRSF
ncbi:MAG: DEAD/DEAH box helicase family protein, partial [Coriobacteriia bacterium]|nr:DEAD/DEAH box helicase family protein [Coriobacteriia bacterium]